MSYKNILLSLKFRKIKKIDNGYGKVHEIALNKVFDSIETYNDLRDAFFNSKELKRKDNKGTISDTFKNWKILKIMSVYKN